MKKIILLSLMLFVGLVFARGNYKLYQQPNLKAKSTTIQNSNENLVPFYHKKNWTKVGDSSTGDTGWIYQQPTSVSSEANTEIIKVTKTQGKNGKEEIIAYKNGKKLNQEQAQKMWREMQMQQKNMHMEFQQMQQKMLKNATADG